MDIRKKIIQALQSIEIYEENIKEEKQKIKKQKMLIQKLQENCNHEYNIEIEVTGGSCIATCKICGFVEVA